MLLHDTKVRSSLGLAFLVTLFTFVPAHALEFEEQLYDGLEYRSIGPYRGGRSAAVAGVPGDALTWYCGYTGGGVFKTTDGGQSWKPISDDFFGGSIGAVAVSVLDPNVVYVGGGEVTIRGNVSHGSGMWRSTDAGRSWKSIGLTDSHHIPRVRIHPRNPDLVYAAALGHLYGPSEERGIYRSRDAGETWERILFVSEEAGAVELEMDPTNPRILYASFWRVRRTPYSLESGGEGSSIWMSTDGGDNWEEITHRPGLPQGVIGISAVAVSPANPDRLWAIIEAEDGGVFRSDDRGDQWKRVNDERKLRQRAWYYTRIYADTQDPDKCYVLNVGMWRSKDGGKSYERIRTPHGDHHDLWIDPHTPDRMIVGDDGGGQVSFDAGANWTTYHNQPTAQFYRVTVDNSFPYRIYGAQQDNSTVRIVHRTGNGFISEFDWEPTAGGESGWIAPDPTQDNEVVYGGSYGGYLTRIDHRSGEERAVNVWPDNPMGHGAEGMNPRFQWNFPILFSHHEPGLLYTAGNFLYATHDEGHSWEQISPDLTRNDASTLGPSGGPITKDNTGVEYYATIFAVAEDRLETGVIWCGSDDGLMHITRDAGANWENVTPPTKLLPEWAQINSIEAHPFHAGGAYVAATRYKSDDFHPYLLRTLDYGKSWKRIDKGIDEQHFTRVVRADPDREGLLYAGTELGMYISFDDGKNWGPFQLNLPVTPITDLAVTQQDLVVATQGRSFWVLDDLSPLHQLSEEVVEAKSWLYQPRDSYRLGGLGRWPTSQHNGDDLEEGVLLHYIVPENADSTTYALRILDSKGEIIRSFTPDAEEAADKLPFEAGCNRMLWDLRYPDAKDFDGMILWAGLMQGPRAVPGAYRVRLVSETDSTELGFAILADPRSTASQEELQEQFDFLLALRDELSEVHGEIERLREVRAQLQMLSVRLEKRDEGEPIRDAAKSLSDSLTSIEQALYQTQNRSAQDPLNYPIRLNNKLAALAGTASIGDYAPAMQMNAVREQLMSNIDGELAKLEGLYERELMEFNALVRDAEIPAVLVPRGGD